MATTQKAHVVAVVLDPVFGDRLLALAVRVHVWIIDTPVNMASARLLPRDADGGYSLEYGATTFSANETIPPDKIVAGIIGTIELHHGEYSHTPPMSVLEVFGADPTPRLMTALADYGFSKTAPIDGGFKAWRAIEGPE
ncbi:MAG: hypothetical protein ACKV0T_17300 [Planctomycetales bacterium]